MGIGGFFSTLLEAWNKTNKDGSTRVGAHQVLESPPALYALNKISGHVGQMPLVLKKRTGSGAENASDHIAYRAVKNRPNKYQTPSVFKEMLMKHYLVWGELRAVKVESGGTIELLPLLPYDTCTVWVDGEKWHVTKLERNSRLSLIEDMLKDPVAVVSYPDEVVIHVPWVTLNGINGMGVLDFGKRTIGMSIDADKHVAKSLSKGFSGRAMLEAPPGAFRKEEDAKEFLANFKKAHDGPKGDETGMLREGVKLNLIANTARDQQLIEQRLHQRQDTALIFMLESMIGDDSSVSYNSLEQKHLAYLVNCLGSILVKWEEECNEKLLSDAEKRADSHFFKFNTGALLRTDYPTTITTLAQALQARIITRNEAREKLDLNTVEGGDVFENPNIDTRQDESTPDEPTDESSDDTEQQNNRRADAIRSRLEHMLNVERKRVVNATGSKDYIAWADKFYSRWQTTFGDVISELGGDEALAGAYCERHKLEILKVYDVATSDVFQEEIEKVTAGWSTEGIVKSILEDLGNGS